MIDTYAPGIVPTIDGAHAVHSFQWGQRKKALTDMLRAKAVLEIRAIRRDDALNHYRSVQRTIEQDIYPLLDLYPGDSIPRYIMNTVVHASIRLAEALTSLCNSIERFAKAERSFDKARAAFEKADIEFRQSIIRLAEVPTKWTASAKVYISDQSTGAANVFYGGDGLPGPNTGHCVVYPNGVAHHFREPRHSNAA